MRAVEHDGPRTWAGLFAYSLAISLGAALSLTVLTVVLTGLAGG